jgi:hypothetical protein
MSQKKKTKQKQKSKNFRLAPTTIVNCTPVECAREIHDRAGFQTHNCNFLKVSPKKLELEPKGEGQGRRRNLDT